MSGSGEIVIDARGESSAAAGARVVRTGQQLGYTVVGAAPGTFRFARSYRPTWATITAIALLVFGIPFWFVRKTETATVAVFEDRSGTKLRVVGHVSARLTEALAPSTAAVPSAVTPPVAVASQPPAAPTSPPGDMMQGGWPAPAPAPPVPPTPSAPPLQAVPNERSTFAPGGVERASLIELPELLDRAPSPSAQPEQATILRASDSDVTIARAMTPRRLVLALPDGRVITPLQPVLIGRDPDPAKAPGSEAIAIDDPTLSKTHAVMRVEGGQLSVTDLHSTNGTTTSFESSVRQCIPDQPVLVPVGGSVVAGTVEIQVRSAP